MSRERTGGQRDIGIVEKNFFFIDINNLDTAETHLYGYCIANDLKEKGLSFEDPEFPRAYSNGAYVLIQNIDDKIYISQDYSGSYGLYLFRQRDYFALSNSFLLMLEKLAAKFQLSFNFDYANAYIVSELCSLAYSETLVNEIEVLPRNVQVIIDKEEKKIETIDIDYQEHSVEAATAEGLQILDQWYLKWLCIIRGLVAESNDIMCDLTGGFDSRLTFGLFLHAGIDLENICFNSGQNAKEDYAAASRIAEFFSIPLNTHEKLSEGGYELELEECLNIYSHTNLGIHKSNYWRIYYRRKQLFWFNGNGGECIRAWHFEQPQLYLENECRRGKRYENIDVSEAVNMIMNNAYKKAMAKFPYIDKNSSDLTRLMYRETRCRNHFSRQQVEKYCVNNICISPLMDLDLGKLCNRSSHDGDLLIALIYTRYYPELLNFPFEGDRKIRQGTLDYAGKINKMFPYKKPEDMNSSHKTMFFFGDNRITYTSKNSIRNSDVDKFVCDVFKSDKVHRMVAACFHKDIYEFADFYMKICKFENLWNIHPILSAYIVLDILANSGRIINRSLFERMQDTIACGPINPSLRLKDTSVSLLPMKKLSVNTSGFLFPFERIPQNTNIILYGAGKVGQAYYKQIKETEYCGITAWVDRNYEKIGVQDPNKIEEDGTFDYIVIAVWNEKTAEQIKSCLLNKGVDAKKITWRP